MAFESRIYRQSFRGYRAWLHRLREMGVEVVEPASTEAMAIDLASMYLSDQEEPGSHRTLNRHIAVKPYALNPQAAVLSLMAVDGVRIGESTALALVGRSVDTETGEITYRKYESLWQLFHADPADIAATVEYTRKDGVAVRVGPAVVKQLFAALGRYD